MVKCSFSGKEIPPGQGKMYVKNDGRVLYFYSNREFKLFQAGRKPFKLSWTADARKAKEMRMAAQEQAKKDKPTEAKKQSGPKKTSKHALKQQKKDAKVKTVAAKAEKKKSAESKKETPAAKQE